MRSALLAIACSLISTAVLHAGDWPMWRYDAARSAASPDEIATNLTLLWSRKLPPVRQAWPLEPNQRLNFDASYEPVVMGKLLFLGSPNDGSITAYSTETGEEQWKVYTEGPVRCAPACWKGRLYAGSDDGYLYCLDAKTGSIVWKFRGAPEDRPDRRHLGNGHLVSFWPVRGGPVIVNDVVYFAAGIWPIFGVFIHALDAETSQVKWTNGALNYIAKVRIDHNEVADTGLSPQGCLAVGGDRLIVPNGRSLPAGLELATGKLVHYVHGHRSGSSRVAVGGGYAFVGTEAMVNLYDFREAGSRWAYRGTNAPEGYKLDDALEATPFSVSQFGFSYKMVEGCDAASAFADGRAYGAARGVFYAYDVAKATVGEYEQAWSSKNFKLLKWQPPLVWQFKSPSPGQFSSVVIKAGRRIYGYAGKKLMALEDLAATPRLAREMDLDGTPTSLIAADNKLFVTTAEGGIYCFGDGPTGKTYAAQATPLEPERDEWSDKARQIVKATGVKAGYCLVLGLSDGGLVEELLRDTELLVIGVDADAKKIDRLRRRLDAAALLGSRVELFVAKPSEFLLPPYLASLLVSEDAQAAGLLEPMQAAKLFEVLRPYGGTLCLEWPKAARPTSADWVKGADATNAVAKETDGWSLLVREGALPGSAPWTHEWGGDAGRTFCSQDGAVKAPLGLLWYGDENGFTQVHDYGTGVKAEVVGGRVFATQRHSNRIVLFAYDAFTGRLLWTNEVRCFKSHARLVSLADAVYLAADGKCYVHDPATGQRLNTFTFLADAVPSNAPAIAVKDLRVDGDALLVLCGAVTEQEISKDEVAYWNWGLYAGTTLVCLDRRTGKERWRREAKRMFAAGALALGGRRVFVADAAPFLDPPAGRWRPGATNESRIIALDARSGKECWRRTLCYEGPTDWWRGGDFCEYSAPNDVLLCGKNRRLNALEPASGKTIWENKPFPHTTAIVIGKTIFDWDGGTYDLATGNRLPGALNTYRGGCNYPIGSRHLLTVRTTSASYTDLESNKRYDLRNVRSGCSNSLIPADGLLNSPNYSWGCTCNYAIQTSFAMVPMPEVEAWMGAAPVTLNPPPARPVEATSAQTK